MTSQQETPSPLYLKGVDCWSTTNEPNKSWVNDMTDTNLSNWRDSKKRELGMASWNKVIYYHNLLFCVLLPLSRYTKWCIGTLQILYIPVFATQTMLPELLVPIFTRDFSYVFTTFKKNHVTGESKPLIFSQVHVEGVQAPWIHGTGRGRNGNRWDGSKAWRLASNNSRERRNASCKT